MLNKIAFGSSRWRRVVLIGRRIGELNPVVKEVEVLNHEFDDLRVVIHTRAVGAIWCCCQLNDSSLSFLSIVSHSLAGSTGMMTECRALNLPFFSAELKYLD